MKIEILRHEGGTWEETNTKLSMSEWEKRLVGGEGPDSVLSPDGGVFFEDRRVHGLRFPDGRRWDEFNGWWTKEEVERNG